MNILTEYTEIAISKHGQVLAEYLRHKGTWIPIMNIYIASACPTCGGKGYVVNASALDDGKWLHPCPMCQDKAAE